jgi:hypothetical protein
MKVITEIDFDCSNLLSLGRLLTSLQDSTGFPTHCLKCTKFFELDPNYKLWTVF